MTAADFPDSPSVNDEFTAGGRTWKWNGTVWNAVTTVGPTGPTGAGLVTGGSAGQVLVKDSGTDYDAAWVDGFRVFSHGSTGGATRPAGAAVYWRGSVAPVNGANGDLWYDTTGDV